MHMTNLQIWMMKEGVRDGDVARKIKLSRSQISRIRRGETGATHDTALKLAKLTGLDWWQFVQPGTRSKRKRG